MNLYRYESCLIYFSLLGFSSVSLFYLGDVFLLSITMTTEGWVLLPSVSRHLIIEVTLLLRIVFKIWIGLLQISSRFSSIKFILFVYFVIHTGLQRVISFNTCYMQSVLLYQVPLYRLYVFPYYSSFYYFYLSSINVVY